MHLDNAKVDSYISKMKTGKNGIMIELVQDKKRYQIYNEYKNIRLVKIYMLNKKKNQGQQVLKSLRTWQHHL